MPVNDQEPAKTSAPDNPACKDACKTCGGQKEKQPSENTPSPDTNDDPTIYLSGIKTENVTDLRISGPALGWRHARTYNSLHAGPNGEDLAWIQGAKWEVDRVTTWLYSPGNGDIHVIMDATHRRVFTGSENNWTAPMGMNATLVHDGTNDVYRLTYTDSDLVLEFYDFTGAETAWHGMLKSRYSVYGGTRNVYEYTDFTTAKRVDKIYIGWSDADSDGVVDSGEYAYKVKYNYYLTSFSPDYSPQS